MHVCMRTLHDEFMEHTGVDFCCSQSHSGGVCVCARMCVCCLWISLFQLLHTLMIVACCQSHSVTASCLCSSLAHHLCSLSNMCSLALQHKGGGWRVRKVHGPLGSLVVSVLVLTSRMPVGRGAAVDVVHACTRKLISNLISQLNNDHALYDLCIAFHFSTSPLSPQSPWASWHFSYGAPKLIGE